MKLGSEIRCDDCNDLIEPTREELDDAFEDRLWSFLCDECRSRRRTCCGERPEDCRCEQPVLTPSLRGAT